MKNWVRHITLLLLIVVITGCNKDSAIPKHEGLNTFQVIEDFVGTPEILVAGDDFFCFDAIEITAEGNPERRLLFMNQDGSQRAVTQFFDIRTYTWIWGGFYNADGGISIYYDVGSRIRYGSNGDALDTIPDFLEGLGRVPSGVTMYIYYRASGMQQLSDGRFAVYGHLSELRRGFFSLHNSDGSLIFKKFFFLGTPEMNAFSGFVEKPDGTFLLLGSHNSNSPEVPNQIFLVGYDQQGEKISEKVIDYGSGFANDNYNYSESYIFTKELISNHDGTYTCVVNRPDPSAPDQYVEMIRVNEQGEILNTQVLDFAPNNVSVNCTSRSGQPNYGLINQKAIDIDSRSTYGYWYTLDANGNYASHTIFDQQSDNQITNLSILPNQDLIMVGSLRSFGGDYKPFYTLISP